VGGLPVFESIFFKIFLAAKLLSWYKIVLEKYRVFCLLTPVESLQLVVRGGIKNFTFQLTARVGLLKGRR